MSNSRKSNFQKEISALRALRPQGSLHPIVKEEIKERIFRLINRFPRPMNFQHLFFPTLDMQKGQIEKHESSQI